MLKSQVRRFKLRSDAVTSSVSYEEEPVVAMDVDYDPDPVVSASSSSSQESYSSYYTGDNNSKY